MRRLTPDQRALIMGIVETQLGVSVGPDPGDTTHRVADRDDQVMHMPIRRTVELVTVEGQVIAKLVSLMAPASPTKDPIALLDSILDQLFPPEMPYSLDDLKS